MVHHGSRYTGKCKLSGNSWRKCSFIEDDRTLITHCQLDPPENCHLTVKKKSQKLDIFPKKLPKVLIFFKKILPMPMAFKKKRKKIFGNFFEKMSRF